MIKQYNPLFNYQTNAMFALTLHVFIQTEAHPAASRNLQRSTRRPWPTPTVPPSICGWERRGTVRERATIQPPKISFRPPKA